MFFVTTFFVYHYLKHFNAASVLLDRRTRETANKSSREARENKKDLGHDMRKRLGFFFSASGLTFDTSLPNETCSVCRGGWGALSMKEPGM